MKPSTSGLRAVLGLATFFMADLYDFVLLNGVVGHYTNADYDIKDPATGIVYSPKGSPKIERTSVQFHIGVQVDELTITLGATPTDVIGSTQWYVALQEGQLDGAQITLKRAFMPTAGDTSQGVITMFVGTVGPCTIDKGKATIKVLTYLDTLNLNLPYMLFQDGCRWALYSPGCTLVKSAFGVTGSITAQELVTFNTFTCSLTDPTGTYTLGSVAFTSGALNGQSYPVKRDTLLSGYSQLQMTVPFSGAPALGDTFVAYPGCDRSANTCTNKFNNLINFGGTPFIPVPETAL